MQPRKPVFAEAYIEETVEIYVRCCHQEQFSKEELKWAHDVLSEYFTVVTHSDLIANAYKNFLSVPEMLFVEGKTQEHSMCKPYQSSQRKVTDISSEQLFEFFKQRRSIRWFEKKLVEQDKVAAAIEMASQAPSACNRQPFQFYTTTVAEKAAEIAAIPMGTKGFAENIPALIVVMGDLSSYPKEQDRHVIYIDGGLVAMQLMLAFESMGLSTCPINWPDIESNERKLSKRLKLKAYQRPIMMLAVGYAKDTGGIPYSQKKSADQLTKVIE
ncbi:nitroreductase family protein [Colwellia sp. MEBiC06753]